MKQYAALLAAFFVGVALTGTAAFLIHWKFHVLQQQDINQVDVGVVMLREAIDSLGLSVDSLSTVIQELHGPRR